MPKDEELPIEEDPGQEGKELELESKGNEPEGQDGDPLDEIEGEELRKEAKKFRSMAERRAKPDKKPEEKPKETPKDVSGDFLKKSDFELSNQKKATRMATTSLETDSEEMKKAKSDLAENWEQVKGYYVPRRGKDTPEDILEDIQDAYTVFNSRRPKEEKREDARELSQTKIIPGQTTPPAKKEPVKEPPHFRLPTQPKDWYKKPQ